jgi:hypothetical protein
MDRFNAAVSEAVNKPSTTRSLRVLRPRSVLDSPAVAIPTPVPGGR